MNRLTATGITETGDWRALNDRLVAALKPFAPPLAISFHGAGETLEATVGLDRAMARCASADAKRFG
ncbi:MAG: hypothetical protein OXT71_13910 [Acidobacteriota bacterium]|nr:hypothetical protein [Acidobacteriota bacterium]